MQFNAFALMLSISGKSGVMEFRDRAGNQIVAKQRLLIEQLRADFSQVTFASFKPVAAGALRPPGQQRALGAIRLAVGMRRKGFNLFVSGQAGSGRHELVRSILREEGSLKDPPSDWVYLNNFDQPEKPIALDSAQAMLIADMNV